MKTLLGFLVGFSLYVGFQILPSTYKFILLDCSGADFDGNHQCKVTEDGYASKANWLQDYADYVDMTVNPITRNASFISRSVVDNSVFNTVFLKDCIFADGKNWQCPVTDTQNEQEYYARSNGIVFYQDDVVSPAYHQKMESLSGIGLFLFLHNIIQLQDALDVQASLMWVKSWLP